MKRKVICRYRDFTATVIRHQRRLAKRRAVKRHCAQLNFFFKSLEFVGTNVNDNLAYFIIIIFNSITKTWKTVSSSDEYFYFSFASVHGKFIRSIPLDDDRDQHRHHHQRPHQQQQAPVC